MPARRVSPEQRKVIIEEIDRMLENGIIEPAFSPWQSAIVMTTKEEDE
jgi:hypothetical protein